MMIICIYVKYIYIHNSIIVIVITIILIIYIFIMFKYVFDHFDPSSLHRPAHPLRQRPHWVCHPQFYEGRWSHVDGAMVRYVYIKFVEHHQSNSNTLEFIIHKIWTVILIHQKYLAVYKPCPSKSSCSPLKSLFYTSQKKLMLGMISMISVDIIWYNDD